MISSEIIADSLSPEGVRLTTYILKYPRFIHSELMTHRVFSRNAASSRAIPFRRLVEMIVEEPAMPEHWGAEQKGMQSGGVIEDTEGAETVWKLAMHDAIYNARALQQLGVHKSICNRLLEPFAHMTTIVTATEWDNFFYLRADRAAMPEFRILATQMLELYQHAEPSDVGFGEWHIPFGDRMPEGIDLVTARKIAVARCARLSYMTHDKEINIEADLGLFGRLTSAGHWSPLEHIAVATRNTACSGNFRGWVQLRKMYHNEIAHLGQSGRARRLEELS